MITNIPNDKLANDTMNTKLAKTQKAGDTRELLEPEHPSRAQRWTNKAVFFALILVALALGLFLKWSFQSENVLQINNEPFPVRTIREHPEANGVVILKVDFCKNIEAEGDLRMSFLASDREVFLPISKERGPKGCTITEVPVLIPETITPGRYKIKFRVTYDLNPLKRNIVDEFVSQEFDIAPHSVKNQGVAE